MEVGDMLKNLPTRNPMNFTSIHKQYNAKTKPKKMTTYISTENTPPEQVIIPDRSNVILRHLYNKKDTLEDVEMTDKSNDKDTEGAAPSTLRDSSSSSTTSSGPTPRKQLRLNFDIPSSLS